MTVRVARNSIAGAAMRAWSGRNAATTVQCAMAGTELRSVICPLEATLRRRFHAGSRTLSSTESKVHPRLQCSMYSRSSAMLR